MTLILFLIVMALGFGVGWIVKTLYDDWIDGQDEAVPCDDDCDCKK